MNKIFLLLFVFMGCMAMGQNIQIDTFQLQQSERFKEIQSGKMNFPRVRSNNQEIDSLINTDLKNRFTKNLFPNENFETALLKFAGDQMVSLDFQVTYNQNGILSVHVMAEGCGAYCTRYTDYFNYSTVNGKWLRIADVIEHSSEFKSRVNRDQKEQLLAQKNELKNMLNDPDSGVDEPTYKWALEYYEDCEKYADLETFALYLDRIEIIQDCALPNAIKNLKPTIKLMYDVNDFGVDWKLKK